MRDAFKRDLKKALSANSAAASFASRIPTTTEPTANTGCYKNFGYTDLLVWPFGTDANDEAFDMRVLGWRKVAGGTLYVPAILSQVTVTLGAATGVVGADVVATEFFADTIVSEAFGVAVTYDNALDVPAMFNCDITGYEYFEFLFDLDTAAAANALYAAQ